VAALVLSSGTGCGGRSTPPAEGVAILPPLAMDDVTISLYAGSRLSQLVRARHLLVAPAAFGPFQVAGIAELVLTGVEVDVYLHDACVGEAPCGPTPLDDPSLGILRVLDLKGGLPAAGASLLDVGWVLWRGKLAVARISAKQASLRRRGARGRLEHLATGRVVEARRAVWDAPTRSFSIGGGYVFQQGETRSTGERARMDFGTP
jgi:hypothetical protein